jgi:hypothetical protein
LFTYVAISSYIADRSFWEVLTASIAAILTTVSLIIDIKRMFHGVK